MKTFLTTLLLAAACAAGEGYRADVKVTPLLSATTDAAGQPIRYPRTGKPVVRALLVEIPPGGQTGWHRHPLPCYAYMLEGELEVRIEGGKTNVLKAGDALVEVVNLWHNGTNRSGRPAKIVLFATGEEGVPITVRE